MDVINQVKILRRMGFTERAQAEAFEKELDSNPAVGQIFRQFEGQFANDPKYNKVLENFGARIKAELNPSVDKKGVDPVTVMDALNKELSGQNARAEKMTEMLKNNPDKLAAAIPTYREGALDGILGLKEPAATPAGTAPTTKKAAPPTHAPAQEAHKAGGTAKPSPMEVVASPKAEPAPRGDFTVREIAKGLKTSVAQNFPELERDAEAFSRTIESDPDLQVRIGKQLDKNPEFLTQLGAMKSGKDGRLSEGARKSLSPFVQDFLHNPQKLGTDEGMKETMRGFQQAKSGAMMAGVFDWLKTNLGIDLQGFFGPMMAKFSGGVGNMFAGFAGKPVLSMASNGNSMFPTVMVNLKNYRENANNAEAFGRYSPQDMTAYPEKYADGSIFKKEKVLDREGNQVVDKDNKPVFKDVPKTTEITDSYGKKHQVIPSVGALEAKQEKGSYSPNGEWKPGNIRVAVVTDISPSGNASKIESVSMTPAQFEKYREKAEKQAGGRAYPFSAYTEQDAELAGIRPNVRQGGYMVANVDRNSGQVSDPAVAYPAASTGAVTSPVQAPRVDVRELPRAAASNDPEYQLKA